MASIIGGSFVCVRLRSGGKRIVLWQHVPIGFSRSRQLRVGVLNFEVAPNIADPRHGYVNTRVMSRFLAHPQHQKKACTVTRFSQGRQ